MLFDKDDRNQLFPTVFMLWKLPTMMRQILIPGQVSGFVLNGADLMLPGVSLLTGKPEQYRHALLYIHIAICVVVLL
jgi:predicted ribosome-associated RNA-binding protein Tma20